MLNDELAERLVGWLSSEGYMLLNLKGEITHPARHAGERPSVIDLSFTNKEATRQGTFQDWAIDPSIALDSDHFAIKFTINHGRKEVENICGIKYNLKEVNPADWIQAFECELQKVEAALTELEHLENPSNAQLDQYAETLTQAVQAATVMTGKERKPQPFAKPWWDKDLTDAVRRVADARREQQYYQEMFGVAHEDTGRCPDR